MTKHFQIFTSEMGKFRERDKFEFVAEFADKRLATEYGKYLQDNVTNHKKDIIFMECDVETPATDGYIYVVLNVLGEYLIPEEWDLNPEEKSVIKPYKPKKPLTKEPKKKVYVD